MTSESGWSRSNARDLHLVGGAAGGVGVEVEPDLVLARRGAGMLVLEVAEVVGAGAVVDVGGVVAAGGEALRGRRGRSVRPFGGGHEVRPALYAGADDDAGVVVV